MLFNDENSLLFSWVKLFKEIKICKSWGQEAVLENNYSCMFVMNELNEQVHGNMKMERFNWEFLMYYSQSGYVCMVFYRRDGHVIELQQSSKYYLLHWN